VRQRGLDSLKPFPTTLVPVVKTCNLEIMMAPSQTLCALVSWPDSMGFESALTS